jgi:hypothetical protein
MATDHRDESAHLDAFLGQRPHRPGGIRCPAAHRCRPDVGEPQVLFSPLERDQAQKVVGAPGRSDGDPPVDGERQHKPVVGRCTSNGQRAAWGTNATQRDLLATTRTSLASSAASTSQNRQVPLVARCRSAVDTIRIMRGGTNG